MRKRLRSRNKCTAKAWRCRLCAFLVGSDSSSARSAWYRSVVFRTFRENVKAYVGFDDAATESLREAHPLVAPRFGAIIDDFYATIEAHPNARAAITGGAAQIARLKQSLLRWIDELFKGPHDNEYFERRARIGRVHVRIDLPQMYMFTAMDRIRLRSADALREAPGVAPEKLNRMLTALHQILD